MALCVTSQVATESDCLSFARAGHPSRPRTKDGPGHINITVACGGVPVRPGDIVVGDDDGVVIVPADEAERM